MLGASSSLRRTKALEREARARRREEERSNRLLVQLRADLDSLASSEESDEENKMADAIALYHGVHTEDAEAWFCCRPPLWLLRGARFGCFSLSTVSATTISSGISDLRARDSRSFRGK